MMPFRVNSQLRTLRRWSGMAAATCCSGFVGFTLFWGVPNPLADINAETSVSEPAPPPAPLASAAPLVATTEPSSSGSANPQSKTSPWSVIPESSWIPAELLAGEVRDPIAQARMLAAAGLEQMSKTKDYTCKFTKRERINNVLVGPHWMDMKVRHEPLSIYMKFHSPSKGKEALYVADRHDGCLIAHEVGVLKVLAGALKLNPKSKTAMKDCRYPITSAGMKNLIQTIHERWAVELTPEESVLVVTPKVEVLNRPCVLIQSVHPLRKPEFVCHRVDLYLDHATGFPIRFEAYDWPASEGVTPELIEEYTFEDIKVEADLGEIDFDVKNPAYSFGRF